MSSLYKKLKGSTFGLMGFIIVFCIILLAILGPTISPKDPEALSLGSRLMPPMWSEGGNPEYPLGTDMLGRDVLSRMICGPSWT